MKSLLKKSFVSPVNSVRDPGLNANARRVCYPNAHQRFYFSIEQIKII